jgi:hypothetical protein
MTTETYNGWTNYETWNIALWLQNDESLYKAMLHFIETTASTKYKEFINSELYGENSHTSTIQSASTDDSVYWLDPKVNIAELDAIFQEIKEEGRKEQIMPDPYFLRRTR